MPIHTCALVLVAHCLAILFLFYFNELIRLHANRYLRVGHRPGIGGPQLVAFFLFIFNSLIKLWASWATVGHLPRDKI